jgi:hypothetical protein
MLASYRSHFVDEHRHAANALCRGRGHPKLQIGFFHLLEAMCDATRPILAARGCARAAGVVHETT